MKKLFMLLLFIFTLTSCSSSELDEIEKTTKTIYLSAGNYDDYLFFTYEVSNKYVTVDISSRDEKYEFINCSVEFNFDGAGGFYKLSSTGQLKATIEIVSITENYQPKKIFIREAIGKIIYEE